MMTGGYPMENSLFQYKIPARVDIGKIRVEFENSYEGEGPFGAKSIGEVVINTPLPAISDAIRNAVGKRFYELPLRRRRLRWQRWRRNKHEKGTYPISSAPITKYYISSGTVSHLWTVPLLFYVVIACLRLRWISSIAAFISVSVVIFTIPTAVK